jgi:hypothetical protein
MRILALADARSYPPLAELLASMHRKLDLVVTLGDLDWHDLQALSGYPRLAKMGVYGNHCAGSYMKLLEIADVHDCFAQWQGLTFIGMEGSPRYKKGPFQYEQAEAARMMDRWPKADVILSHCPPRGVHDDPERASHTGWEALTRYVERHQPLAVLHGHTHPASDTDRLGETDVLWVWRHRLIEL